MNNEKRDLVIERLERQLAEKDREFEHIKKTVKDSIIDELQRDMQNGSDVNDRLRKLESRVQEISNNLNGVMNELLDQKSVIRTLKSRFEQDNGSDIGIKVRQSGPDNDFSENAPESFPTRVQSFEADSVSDFPRSGLESAAVRDAPSQKPETVKKEKQPFSDRTEKNDPLDNNARFRKVRFNIRDAHNPPSDNKNAEENKNDESEYIIAESCDNPDFINNRPKNAPNDCKKETSEYIIADDNRAGKKRMESELESVESREGEDAVITTTYRKS
ncbi:conserved hypothetical protein [Methanosalsum zhilinae DSM 4017]|uniref:Uncharacterized protein n=1 Tax=Methanosalsum zhilinae (strain DSM 4017 / NBRC 107636 / OCM 62 / WeN5) TaxID=679901 RepID=F7XMF6_METZD|nr:hypothetical protein [Methanosalsum zhilinae]AEH61832.1 conserved hypothetical protein [Methanosalsum zhilinae DSM 4017]